LIFLIYILSGKRSDLEEVADLVKSGKRMKIIAEDCPTAFIKYHRGIAALKMHLQTPRDFVTECQVFWGPTESGKSRACAEIAGEDVYWLSNEMCRGSTSWWDGYDGQSTVVLDDFYCWLPLNTMLRMLDRYPFLVQTKGGARHFLAKNVLITSNSDPAEWYHNVNGLAAHAVHALRRRIQKVTFIGYGPNKDLKTCPCGKPSECAKYHQEREAAIPIPIQNWNPNGSPRVESSVIPERFARPPFAKDRT
jgi:hypothetical protein